MWKGKRSLAHVWIFCDGSSGLGDDSRRSRPDPLLAQAGCGAAAVARGEDGELLDWTWRRLPQVTNNEAEYAGLILGLKLARRLGATHVTCVLDSDVVVGQMDGRYSVNSSLLLRWHWRACETARGLRQVRYRHIPRAWNRLADGLATQVGIPWEALKGEIEG